MKVRILYTCRRAQICLWEAQSLKVEHVFVMDPEGYVVVTDDNGQHERYDPDFPTPDKGWAEIPVGHEEAVLEVKAVCPMHAIQTLNS